MLAPSPPKIYSTTLNKIDLFNPCFFFLLSHALSPKLATSSQDVPATFKALIRKERKTAK